MYPLHPWPHPILPILLCPSRGIQWPGVILLWVGLTCGQPMGQADLWSDTSLVPSYAPMPLAQCQCPHAPSRDISWPRVILLQVSLTFGQTLGWTILWSDVCPYAPIAPCPPGEASIGQEWYYCSQFDIWSVFSSGWPVVKCTPSPIPLATTPLAWSPTPCGGI